MSVLERSNDGYHHWASSYDATDNPLVAMTRFAMSIWSGNFSGKRVLEIGSGTGRNALFFLERDAREYVGVEPSQAMRESAIKKQLPRSKWLQGSFRELPDELRKSFDVVLCCLVLEHVEDLSQALRAAAEQLVPGGELRVYELHSSLHEKGTRAHFVSNGEVVSLPSFAHEAAAFRDVARTAGLQVQRITEWYASDETVMNVSAKLRKHLEQPVLLEVELRALREHE